MPSFTTLLPDGRHQLALAPNGSLSAINAFRFLFLTGCAMGAIALYFTWRGFWPILPFAGLEFGVLAWALRASMRASARRETILIDKDTVRIERRDPDSVQQREFARHWAKVTLRAVGTPTHPSQLVIESHGRACEIGRFLTETERREIALLLRRMVGRTNDSPPLD